MIRDVDGQIFRDGVEVRRRWAEHFKLVLNVKDFGVNLKCSRRLADTSVWKVES